MFTSSGSTEREIDEYQDESLGSDGSYKSSSESTSSSDSSSQDKQYLSKVPGIPLMQCMTTFGAEASSSRRSRSPNSS